MYYGCADATGQQNTAEVWDASYMSVYHLNHISGSAIDAIGNDDASDGIDPDSNMNVMGIAGRADYFDGNDSLGVDADPKVKWNCDMPFMYEAWIKIGSNSINRVILEDGAHVQGAGIGVYSNGKFIFGGWASSSHKECVSSSDVDDDVWHHVVGVNADNDMIVYVDGEPETTTSSAGDLSPGSDAAGIGNYGSTDSIYIVSSTAYEFLGYIDEIRVSSTNCGADWIKTQYNNQSHPETFFSIVPWGRRAILVD
jgi:hypothetical protein